MGKCWCRAKNVSTVYDLHIDTSQSRERRDINSKRMLLVTYLFLFGYENTRSVSLPNSPVEKVMSDLMCMLDSKPLLLGSKHFLCAFRDEEGLGSPFTCHWNASWGRRTRLIEKEKLPMAYLTWFTCRSLSLNPLIEKKVLEFLVFFEVYYQNAWSIEIFYFIILTH